ncbi:MAG: hypothetical protein RL385_4369 [Pseudomonadota bacterium]|jgi:hypothetical protein
MQSRSPCTCAAAVESLVEPVASDHNLRAARDAYFAENGFTLADYSAQTVTIKAFGLALVLPNGPGRQWAVSQHDLHHVATGFGTDLVGEGELAAWELGAGCRRGVVYALNAMAFTAGFLLAPLRVLRAFRLGRGQRTLYRHPREYEALLDQTVGELRRHLGLPDFGLADKPRKLHEDAWKALHRSVQPKR